MLSPYFMIKFFSRATHERRKREGLKEPSPNVSTRNESPPRQPNIPKKCRICLHEGIIPIYNTNTDADLSKEVCSFGDIEISANDEFPKHLCVPCFKLLQAAMLFRKTAQQSAHALKGVRLPKEASKKVSQSKKQRVEEEKSDLREHYSSVEESDLPSEETKPDKLKVLKVKCKICSKIMTKPYFKEHYALHDPNTSKYICDVCGKSFRQRSAYANHYSIHSNKFTHKCELCPYRAKYRALLKAHMLMHSGDYKFMCTECPMRFLTKSNLNKHALQHKEPAFKCETCNRAYHNKLTLERHYEVDHLGIKNHVCNLCGKSFGYRKSMMKHQLYVHKRARKLSGRTPAYMTVEQDT